MKQLLALLLTTVTLMASVDTVVAQSSHAPLTRIPVRPDSRLWLEGSSNIRDWTCRATSLDASVAVEAASRSAAPGSPQEVVRGVSVKVPVRMLKCGDRHMEAEMYSALKSPDTAPGFITAEVERIPSSVANGQVVEAEATLTIAGVQRTVKMSVTSDSLPDGTRRARGTVPIKMTDFGIKPPRPWGGILRTADRVLIQFEIFIAARP